jgi:hypothetical protein
MASSWTSGVHSLFLSHDPCSVGAKGFSWMALARV